MNQFDLIVIGAGPAGISAGIYARRAGFNVLIVHNGALALEKAHRIDNYYGFPDGISGTELYANGIKQAQNLGITVVQAEVTHVEINSDLTFCAKTTGGEYSAKSLVLATGNKKLRPSIRNLTELEGKGVSYCAVCDAFFYRKKNVCVVGNGEFALSEARVLQNVASSVTILTNGENSETLKSSLKSKSSSPIAIDERKIEEVNADSTTGKVSGLTFKDGTTLKTDGIFIALGEAGAADFAKKIGILLEGENIKTDSKMRTNVPGIFACGNATGGLLQVNKAAYEGALAGLSAVEFLKKQSAGV